jgi:sulfate adenylyltransferase subunit 1
MKVNGENKFKSLLRFTTAGSVDDGKSTLIGRLLYDSKSIFEDQMEHIISSSKRLGKEETDLSLLTDGLRAEREQGITIDVAYRYFSTPVRKFIIADTPGHIQYTRNMVTGASTADLAVILIDARKGVLEQTLRHTYIATLLDIRHILFCVNKMDLVGYSEEVFVRLRADLEVLGRKLGVANALHIPISARFGDNVVERSANMDWYKGKTFLDLLETVEIIKDKSSCEARFPVQTVIRPLSDEFHDFRGFAGRMAGGSFSTGDAVVLLPGQHRSVIKEIYHSGKSSPAATTGDSVVITLKDEVDVTRGCLLVKDQELPCSGQEPELMICWFNEKPLTPGVRYLVRNHASESVCMLGKVNYKVNINTLEHQSGEVAVGMNDIAHISIKSAGKLHYDPYIKNNITGSLVFIDPATNETVGAGMIY